ncbi:MAG: NAD(P)-binding protein [Opitutaceae bacterium]
MRPAIPIEIVGGGLAGLSLGLALRRADVPVTIFEAGEYPRHRVCGEFIAGLGPNTIRRLGLAPLLSDALRHHEVAWFMGAKPTRVQRLPSPAFALSRHILDARLAETFVAAGGELRTHTRVTPANATPGRVLASGRRRGASPWIGLKFHVRSLALARELELHLGDQAYVGLARVENGRVNVCGLFHRRPLSARGPNLLLAYLRAAGLSALAERLASAEPDPDSCCAVAAVTFDFKVPTEDDIRLGDACAMIPPFTGNGMAMAFQSAELALDPLVAYSRGERGWIEARDAINAALRRRFRLRLASAAGLHSFLLRPSRQRWLALVNRTRLLPFRSLYAVLH